MTYGLMYDPVFLEHYCERLHPERPERLEALLAGLKGSRAWPQHRMVPARSASNEELQLAHRSEYVERVLDELAEGRFGHIDADTFYSPGSREAALKAAGGTIDLAEAVHRREVDYGIALGRPPGHHATRSRARGFCIFNNIALAAASLIHKGLAERVAIFDWDVHHGNGTQDQMWDRRDVLFISAHQWPLFPGSGLVNEIGGSEARGYTVNVPLPPGTDGSGYLGTLQAIALPLFEQFQPDHILVSAGFDSHGDDPLANLECTTKDYGAMTGLLREAADELCDGRLTLVVEGGYNLGILQHGIRAVSDVLSGGSFECAPATDWPDSVNSILSEVKSVIRPCWDGWSG